jgi:hypothetical protein
MLTVIGCLAGGAVVGGFVGLFSGYVLGRNAVLQEFIRYGKECAEQATAGSQTYPRGV